MLAVGNGAALGGMGESHNRRPCIVWTRSPPKRAPLYVAVVQCNASIENIFLHPRHPCRLARTLEFVPWQLQHPRHPLLEAVYKASRSQHVQSKRIIFLSIVHIFGQYRNSSSRQDTHLLHPLSLQPLLQPLTPTVAIAPQTTHRHYSPSHPPSL